MEFFTLDQLAIEGVSLGPVVELEIHNRPGEHGWMRVRAQVGEEEEETILYRLASRQPGRLYGTGQLLFAGLLSQVEFYRKDQVRYGILTFRTADCLMDVEKKSRSFQDTSMTYSELLDQILQSYPGSAYLLSVPDEPIGQLLVQYQETDWQFLKRVFSQRYASGSHGSGGVRFRGLPGVRGKLPGSVRGAGCGRKPAVRRLS